MRATRGLVLSALSGWLLMGWTGATDAQIYDAARRSLDFSPDATARSPRLLGMGTLSLASDAHNGINLRDLYGNPIAIYDSDTLSTFATYPGTSSASRTAVPVGGTGERQNLAAREIRMGYEAFRRGESSTYGFYGDLGNLRKDQPFSDATVLRGNFQQARLVGFINGRMPRFHSDRMRYEIHGFVWPENQLDEYRTQFSNGAGDYLGRQSDILPPPNFFDPDEYRISSVGGGLGFSYRFATLLNLSVSGEAASSRIEGENSDKIHDMGTGEDRPYYVARAGVTGKYGHALEYALDGGTWTSAQEKRYVFTLKAGQNQNPFTGRGKMLDRDEDGHEGRAQVRWTWKQLELNAAAGSWKRTLDIQPTPPGEAGSYNLFLNTAANRLGADSLALPDSVQRSHSKDEGWGFAYGATWRLPGKGLVGREFHFLKQSSAELVYAGWPGVGTLAYTGDGPDRRISDIRGGIEYPCTAVLTGRLGYIRRSDDHDELTRNNEYQSNTLTSGLTLQPVGSRWNVDLGWAIEWIAPDFDDATNPKESRQQVAAQIRWVF